MKVSFRHQLNIEYSRVIEALSLMCTLGKNMDHVDVMDFDEFEPIKVDNMSFFAKFSQLPQLRFAWLEFALLSFEREDVQLFIQEIRSNTPAKQLVTLLGHEVDESEAMSALSSPEEAIKLVNRYKYDESLIAIITSLSSVIDQFCDLLKTIDAYKPFNNKLDTLIQNKGYDALLEQFTKGTFERHPLSYAQEVMGKPFWNIADYTRYEFVPVYFISPYSMRLMDGDSMIFIQAINRRPRTPEAFLESVLDPLKSVSDATRLKILRMLYMHPMYGKEIAEALNLTTATVSHHLEALFQQGLVNVEKVKQIKYFSTNYTRLSRSLDEVTKYIKEK